MHHGNQTVEKKIIIIINSILLKHDYNYLKINL
jgi:hypothetical protein